MDQKLFSLINHDWTGPVLDRFMALLSNFNAWILPLVVLVFFLLWRGGFRGWTLVLCAGIVVGINDGIVSHSLKEIVNRPRPRQSLDEVREVELAKATPRILGVLQPARITYSIAESDLKVIVGHSFPSSHTINTISVALLVTCFFRRLGWLAFLPALAVGYSRIYVGAHWPSDVFASIFLGLGTTLVWLAGLEWLWGKVARHWWPGFHERHPSLLQS
jgi:undecaprenyl-diphosphatase